MKELIAIINELHAPKNKTNNFGKFNYRDAAGILEAVKPLLVEHSCLLTVDTDVVLIGDRYYVKAVAIITNPEGVSVTATAFAREQDSKSGMDAAQLTGACNSYAKKYALCNLLDIDDSSDDPDTDQATKRQKDTMGTGVNKQDLSGAKAEPAKSTNDDEAALKSWEALRDYVASFSTQNDAVTYLKTNHKQIMPISTYRTGNPVIDAVIVDICNTLSKLPKK